MKRRILHLWFPYLETDWLERYKCDLRGKQLVTIRLSEGRQIIVSVNQMAANKGVRTGTSLADARAILPTLVHIEHRPRLLQKVLNSMADYCDRYTPYISLSDLDGLHLDVTGCPHLFGGEDQLLERAIASFNKVGYTVRGCIADTPSAAWAIARCGEGGVIACDETKDALSPLPVHALRLEAGVVSTLRHLGLRTIGQLYKLPRAALSRRFTKLICEKLDMALGIIHEPISPRKYVSPYIERAAFAEPISTQDNIEEVLAKLLDSMCLRLIEAGIGIRQAELRWYCVDGYASSISIGTSAPSRLPAHLFRLFRTKIETIDPRFGIEAMALAATRLDTVKTRTVDLLGETDVMIEDKLASFVDCTVSNKDIRRVWLALPNESHWPVKEVTTAPVSVDAPDTAFKPDVHRPIRMQWPEPVKAMAQIPDYPPTFFIWRKQRLRVVAAEGAERVSPEWWQHERELRDYYLVEDDRGTRSWIYRSGLYKPDQPNEWFLHGYCG